MNYTKLLYKLIGERIQKKRKTTSVYDENHNLHKATLDLIDIDNAALSRIQNGIALKKKNPYLLSVGQIEELSRLFHIDKYELVWGNLEEQELFIKILLLAIIFNGTTYKNIPLNPFYNDGTTTNELISPIEYNSASDKDFFYSEKNYELFILLNNKYDKKLLALSDLLLKQLLNDYKFCSFFTQRTTNKIFNQDYDFISAISESKHIDIYNNIEYLLIHPSRFILEAIDYKEYNYIFFINAFNNMWMRNKNKYLEFFREKIFCNTLLEEKGLKAFQDKDISRIIKSVDFFELVNSASVLETFTNPEAILASNYFVLSVQAILQKNALVYIPNFDSSLWNLLSDSTIQIDKLSQKIL